MAEKKTEPKVPAKATDTQRIDAIVKLLKTNGLSLPKELED